MTPSGIEPANFRLVTTVTLQNFCSVHAQNSQMAVTNIVTEQQTELPFAGTNVSIKKHTK
jgi:hypothetical protein